MVQERICQARDGSNTPIRSYYEEGEYVPGTPASLYYGIDQIGSVRRVFASTTSAPAYNYDPNGVPLQATAPVTDFVFGGMFYNADSGLYLTNYRAYDPVAGRWLSRDLIGETSDPLANLYAYVSGNTPNVVDPLGLVGTPSPSQGLSAPSEGCQEVKALPRNRGQPPCLLAGLEGIPCGVAGGGGGGGGGGGIRGSGRGGEHTKNPRPSNLPKHEEGQTRKKRDYGGEKGDERRDPPRRKPPGWKGPWPPSDNE